jgi:hypothetical protein
MKCCLELLVLGFKRYNIGQAGKYRSVTQISSLIEGEPLGEASLSVAVKLALYSLNIKVCSTSIWVQAKIYKYLGLYEN